MRTETVSVPDSRRVELGDFLRRRRTALTTDMAGLPPTRRRRTPGLRREEVAELANISTALYAWLEQGRDVPVSRRTVDSIANALQFTPSERSHFHALAIHESYALQEDVSAALARMVNSLRTHPVMVIDHKWDVVLHNRAAEVVFDFEGSVPTQFNLLQVMFDDQCKRLFANWRPVAESLVELFRYDYSLYAEEPGPLALVDELRASDPVFAQIWEAHNVRRAPSASKEINHPSVGSLSVEASLYAVVESPGLRLMIYTPSDDESIRHIDDLVRQSFDREAEGKRVLPVC